MKKTVFTGSAVALVTPFTEQGIDFPKLAELIEFQIANGTDAIVICGTTGESATMPDAEHKEAIRFAVECVAGRVPVIAGTGSNDTAHGITLCQYAESVGADALLLVTPYYNKCTQEGLVRHYTAMAQSVKIPCILYNVPSRTGVNIAPATLERLAKLDNIVGIKEASGNISQVAKIAATCDLDLYSGNDDQIIPLLSLGGKGVISVLANVCPQQTHDMVAEYLEGDRQKALSLQLAMLDLIDALFIEVNPIPVKEALNMMGFACGQLRLPLCEMSDTNREVLRTALQKHNLL